jgi:hypothetical protein
MKWFRMLLTIAFLTFCLATIQLRFNRTTAVMAQATCAGIEGRVTTPEGWVIPMAKVRLLNRDAKQSTNVQTEENGQYAACLSPGTYDVIVITPGFKTAKRKAVKVEASGKSIIDFPMKRGGARTSH